MVSLALMCIVEEKLKVQAVELSQLRNRRHTFERLGSNPLRPLSVQGIKNQHGLQTCAQRHVVELMCCFIWKESCLSASSSIFWEETSNRDCSRRLNILPSSALMRLKR